MHESRVGMKTGVTFTGDALEDFAYWVKKDARTAGKIIKLIEAIQREPFSGIGKPEPLKHELSGYWSRRINLEHRLVYCIKDDAVVIIQCRYHYQ